MKKHLITGLFAALALTANAQSFKEWLDPEINAEMPMVTAIILLQDTSQMHARDEQESARLHAAFDEMRIANRTKTEFLY